MINWVCLECGLTKGTRKPCLASLGWEIRKCDICKRQKNTVEAREYELQNYQKGERK